MKASSLVRSLEAFKRCALVFPRPNISLSILSLVKTICLTMKDFIATAILRLGLPTIPIAISAELSGCVSASLLNSRLRIRAESWSPFFRSAIN